MNGMSNLSKKWEAKRRNNPLPVAAPQGVAAARLNIALKRVEVEVTQAAIEAQNMTPDELATRRVENIRRETLAKGILEDAIVFMGQGDTTNSFDYCKGVLEMMTERLPHCEVPHGKSTRSSGDTRGGTMSTSPSRSYRYLSVI